MRGPRRWPTALARSVAPIVILGACGTAPTGTYSGPVVSGPPTLHLAPDTLLVAGAPAVFSPILAAFTVELISAEGGAPIDAASLTWTSLAPAVAQVSASGLVTGGRSGTARVIAVKDGHWGSALVQVTPSRDSTITVIAHRGFQRTLPENTLVAVDSAFELGADAVEIDVRRARDGVPVLMHDATVDRTTDGTGAVADLTSEQITTLDACAHVRPRRTRCGVPTLREAIDGVRGRGTLVVHFYGDYKDADLLGILSDIRTAGMEGRVVLTAFEYSLVQRIRSLDPFVSVGLIASSMPSLAGIRSLGRSSVLVDVRSLLESPLEARATLAIVRSSGVDVAGWTVQSQEEAERLVALGVRHLITDVPLDRARLEAVLR